MRFSDSLPASQKTSENYLQEMNTVKKNILKLIYLTNNRFEKFDDFQYLTNIFDKPRFIYLANNSNC